MKLHYMKQPNINKYCHEQKLIKIIHNKKKKN